LKNSQKPNFDQFKSGITALLVNLKTQQNKNFDTIKTRRIERVRSTHIGYQQFTREQNLGDNLKRSTHNPKPDLMRTSQHSKLDDMKISNYESCENFDDLRTSQNAKLGNDMKTSQNEKLDSMVKSTGRFEYEEKPINESRDQLNFENDITV